MSPTGTTQVEAITPKQISKEILESSRHWTVFSQIFKENRDLEKLAGRKIVLPKLENSLTVYSDLSEGSSVSPSSISYEGVTVEVAKFGIMIPIDNEALESASRDLISDITEAAGRALATELDLRAATIALDLKEGTVTSWTDGSIGAATAPIVRITSVSGATIDSVDYYKGSIILTGSVSAATVTYLYSNRCRNTGQYVDVDEAEYLKVWDVLELRAKMVDNTVYPDLLLVHPRELQTLLYDPDCMSLFTDVASYKDDSLNGEIGKIGDLRILCSGNVPEGIGILVDSNRLGREVIKREIDLQLEEKPSQDQTWCMIWSEREFAVLDSYAIGIIVNAKTGQYGATQT